MASRVMTHEILINVTPQETRVAMLEQGVVQELHMERASARGLVGNIYLGRVARVLPGMQSAFIEIGLERAAFLHIADIWEHRQNGHGGSERPIEKILHEGQSLLVQVIKDPIGTKGARLSTQVSLAGRLLVYLPQDSHIGISQRIGDEAERETLRERLQHLLPEGMVGGFIIRTMAETATEREMEADIEYLTKLWGDLTVRSREAPPASLLYQDLNLAQRVLRDMSTDETARVLVDSRETFGRMQEFARQYTPALSERIQHYQGDRPLYDLHGVEDEIEKALARRVDLKSGGYLIIDQTEAMTTIDVNTGGFVGGRSFDDTIFKTNLEAAQVIARQLRMRNLGGIIIIDFIDMENADHRNAVLAELNKALEKDRTRLTVNGFTQLGLVEMTRKRTRESLAHVLCETCPTCQGRGETQDRADDLLRDPARDRPRVEAVQRARVPHPRVAVGDRHVPRRGVAEPGAARRLHRQADLAAGRDAVHAGAVRHRADLDRIPGLATTPHPGPLPPGREREPPSAAPRGDADDAIDADATTPMTQCGDRSIACVRNDAVPSPLRGEGRVRGTACSRESGPAPRKPSRAGSAASRHRAASNPGRSSRSTDGSRRRRSSGRAATTSSTCPRDARRGGARRCSCCATAASRRRRSSRRARASSTWPTGPDASCCCRARRTPRIRGAAGTGSTGARCAARARPRSSPRRSAACAAATGSTASACWSPACRPAARWPRSWACATRASSARSPCTPGSRAARRPPR